MQSCRWLATFQRNKLPPLKNTPIPKMEAVSSSETLVTMYKTAWCHHPEHHKGKHMFRSVMIMVFLMEEEFIPHTITIFFFLHYWSVGVKITVMIMDGQNLNWLSLSSLHSVSTHTAYCIAAHTPSLMTRWCRCNCLSTHDPLWTENICALFIQV